MQGRGEVQASQGRLNRDIEVVQQPANQIPREGGNRAQRSWIRPYLGMMPTAENLKFIEDNKILFLSGKTQVVDPLSESYPTMLHQSYCPHWQLFSLTTIVLLICVIYYIVAVSIGYYNNTFLQVGEQTYTDMGVNKAKLVYRGQVYRLVLCEILHVNLIHLIANMLVLTIILSAVEYTFGWWRTGLVFFGSAIVGNVFSDLISVDQSNEMIKSGSINALFGIIGIALGYLLINWPALHLMGPIFKFKAFSQIILAAIFLLLFSDVAQKDDFAGHLGGVLAGFFLSGSLPSIQLETREILIRVILVFLFSAMTLSCILCFYLAPQDSYSN